MAVDFTCPACGNSARIVSGGYVEEHEGRGGATCTFTRTARSGGAGPKPTLSVEEREAARRREKEAKRAANPPKPKRQKVSYFATCKSCEAKVRLRGEIVPAILPAHQRPSGRWCSAGTPPTDAQRRRAASRSSVRTVSGGLPGLGRR